MPHVAAHSRALLHIIMPQSCNYPHNPATDSHTFEPHARAPCAILTHSLMCLVLAYLSSLFSRAHHASHLRVHYTTRSRAYCAHALARCCVCHHACPCACCPPLLAPMPQSTLCCHAPVNVTTFLCFCTHHKHAHLLPRLGTRPQSKPRQVAPMTHDGDSRPLSSKDNAPQRGE